MLVNIIILITAVVVSIIIINNNSVTISFLREKLDFYSFVYFAPSQVHLISVDEVEVGLTLIFLTIQFKCRN